MLPQVRDFYRHPLQDLLTQLDSSAKGLSNASAHERLKEFGANDIDQIQEENLVIQFLKRFTSPLVINSLSPFFSRRTETRRL